jgi:hypothetical protein
MTNLQNAIQHLRFSDYIYSPLYSEYITVWSAIVRKESCSIKLQKLSNLKHNFRLVFNLVPRTGFYKVTGRIESYMENNVFSFIVYVLTIVNLHFVFAVYLTTLSTAQCVQSQNIRNQIILKYNLL